ncbi:GNAT family N-acetyltransferase [Bacillus paralicheniformis]|uniref:GNAT family N-acetyltransferase n=1 Tax=Bacillus paralicheniformis TaxID=1648923 RepID=UPI003F7ACE81
MKHCFLQTTRIGFSLWAKENLNLAKTLWGNRDVAKYLTADGIMTDSEIRNRLLLEIEQYKTHGVQYFPIFKTGNNEFIGCCGLRPYVPENDVYELGFHLVRSAWGKGYASEAAEAMIEYAFNKIRAKKLFAGHHPENTASQKRLEKLGFVYTHDEFYPSTGLQHPSYELKQPPGQ